VRRLPIRLRLTFAFAGAMAILLGATGAFVYLRLGSSIDATINSGLRTRSSDLAALVQQSGGTLGDAQRADVGEPGDSFAQVLRPDGTTLDSSTPLLSRAEVARAMRGSFTVDRARLPGFDDSARLLALPLVADGRRLVLVVGASTESRAETLEGLLTQLLVAAPIALVLASLLAYALATAALRPVESMRRRAASIHPSDRGQRLPLPDTDDEIARLGQTLNDLLARLETARERERRFVADASHELRTPLALLRSELELAQRRPRSREELESALASAAEETERLSRLADDLLVLARADADGLALRRDDVRVREIAERVGARFDRRAARTGRTVDVEAPTDLELVGDRTRIEQALTNLVDNALRHGGGAVRIVAGANNGSVELHVLDEGPGFDDGFAAHAFERFTRADEARANGGAGLGLAIAQAIAQAHGGTSFARNRDDKPGADVWLVLPRR
jgi:signal transduction histidine kinase